ncbi:helix-turn-helix transcriptional regulator, partial [Flavobacterium sp. B17]
EILGCGMKRVVPAGSGFFMKKGSYLVSDKIEDEEKDYESIIIFFSDTWLQSQIDTIFDCKNTSDTQGEDCLNGDIALLEEDKLMNSVIDQLKSYFELSQDKERLQILLPFKIRELFQILISAPNGYHFEKRLRSLDNHHNPDLVVLMQNNYKENISLEQYAFLANCSLSTFKRKFMQTFKTNPGKWIMQRRLEESYELLKKSEKNVTEIAYEVGFETPAHFIASFKQKYR